MRSAARRGRHDHVDRRDHRKPCLRSTRRCSRCKVFRLDALEPAALQRLLERAIGDGERGPGPAASKPIPKRWPRWLTRRAATRAGAEPARGLRCLAFTRGAPTHRRPGRTRGRSSHPALRQGREEHYNVVSALIKSMRGSDPDAAIYWLMRMLEAGDDPLFVLAADRLRQRGCRQRRSARARGRGERGRAFRRVGMPEVYPIAHACLYLAACPKSNSVGKAFSAARALIQERGALPVPKKLRNAVTGLMRDEGYGEDYRSPHDRAEHHVAGGNVPAGRDRGHTLLRALRSGSRKVDRRAAQSAQETRSALNQPSLSTTPITGRLRYFCAQSSS